MTLKEQIALGEAMGLKLLGFYVASDLYAALCAACPPVEKHTGSAVPVLASELLPLSTGLLIVVSDHLPAGCAAPYFVEREPMRMPNPLPFESLQEGITFRAFPGLAPSRW